MAYIEDTAVGPECRPVPEQEMRCPATRPPPLWRAAHGVALLATFATAEREEMTGIRRPLPPSYTMQGMDMDVGGGWLWRTGGGVPLDFLQVLAISCGLMLLSTGFNRDEQYKLAKLCSWAALATKNCFSGATNWIHPKLVSVQFHKEFHDIKYYQFC